MVAQRVLCPQCRTPVVVNVQQVFDVREQPAAKTLVLSGTFNVMQCPVCGFVGQVPTPIVYHDPTKELLLVYVPPGLGLTQEQQEQVVGPLLQQIMRHLPQEQRKAYLLQPQYVLSLRSLQERILEADGITREMLEAQERRLSLLQRLLNTDDQTRITLLSQENELVDLDFWDLLSYSLDAAQARGDKVMAQRLERIQELVVEHTEFGQKIKAERKAFEEAAAFAKSLPQRLTPKDLVDRLLAWPHLDKTHLMHLVRLVPHLLAYETFQVLREVEKTGTPEKQAQAQKALDILREILDTVQEVQKQMERDFRQAFHEAMQAADEPEALKQRLAPLVGFFVLDPDFALHLLRKVLAEIPPSSPNHAKADKVVKALEAVLIPPEERLLALLLETKDPAIWKALLEKHRDAVNTILLNRLTEAVASMSEAEQTVYQPLVERVARMVMEQNLRRPQPQTTAPAEALAQASQPETPRILRPGEERTTSGPSQLIRPS